MEYCIPTDYLQDSQRPYGKYKDLADRSLARVIDAQLFAVLAMESNSCPAGKHMAANLLSPWTGLLTTPELGRSPT